LALGVIAAAGLTGCADLGRATAAWGPASLNVESPAAPAVQAAQTQPMRFPSFRDVPPRVALKDQRSGLEWSRDVQGLNRSGAALNAWAQENPSMAPTTADSFNASALAALKYDPADVPPEDQAARTEAFANSVRDQATPPPPPK
jgi:hypothetical protein